MTTSFQILPNSSFIYHPAIRSFRATILKSVLVTHEKNIDTYLNILRLVRYLKNIYSYNLKEWYIHNTLHLVFHVRNDLQLFLGDMKFFKFRVNNEKNKI
jgi:hypothetical protein